MAKESKKRKKPGKIARHTRYWNRHELPKHKIAKRTSMHRRMAITAILERTVSLCNESDVLIATIRSPDLVRNRAFIQHEQKRHGALERLRRSGGWQTIPPRIEREIFKTAFVTTEKR